MKLNLFKKKKKKEKKFQTVRELVKLRERCENKELRLQRELKFQEGRIERLKNLQEILCPLNSISPIFFGLKSSTNPVRYYNDDLHSAIEAKISEISKGTIEV